MACRLRVKLHTPWLVERKAAYVSLVHMSAEPLWEEVAMAKNVTVTTFPIWRNAGPSTVDKPTIKKETHSKENLDLPWQVVVHNDPVNLMSYVTMVFQRVFGYPREKAERHMLEVHHNRSEEHTSELQSQSNLVCRLLLEKKK